MSMLLIYLHVEESYRAPWILQDTYTTYNNNESLNEPYVFIGSD